MPFRDYLLQVACSVMYHGGWKTGAHSFQQRNLSKDRTVIRWTEAAYYCGKSTSRISKYKKTHIMSSELLLSMSESCFGEKNVAEKPYFCSFPQFSSFTSCFPLGMRPFYNGCLSWTSATQTLVYPVYAMFLNLTTQGPATCSQKPAIWCLKCFQKIYRFVWLGQTRTKLNKM